MSRRFSTGLTLLEVLVVLTLTGMISAVMFQGYGYLLGSYQRMQNRQSLAFERSLVEAWWRDSLENLVPYFDDELRFSGADYRMRGGSYMPLRGAPGTVAEILWELQEEATATVLYYQQPPARALVIARWQAGERVRFQFLDETGEWLPRWVPGESLQLPEAVQLSVESASGELLSTVTAVVATRKTQEVPSSDLLYGRE